MHDRVEVLVYGPVVELNLARAVYGFLYRREREGANGYDETKSH